MDFKKKKKKKGKHPLSYMDIKFFMKLHNMEFYTHFILSAPHQKSNISVQ